MGVLVHPRGWVYKPPLGTQIAPGHPLAAGLLQCVLLNEGNPNAVRNLVLGRIFAVSGAPTWNVTQDAPGVRFPATADLLTDTNGLILSGQTQFTWMVRASVEESTTTRKRAFRAFQAAFGTVAQIEFSDGANPNIAASILNAAGGAFPVIGPTYKTMQSYTVLVRWGTNETVQMFVDGLWAANSVSSAADMAACESLSLGANTSGAGNQLQGTLYLAYVWNRRLSDGEIQWLHQNPYAFLTRMA